MSPIHFGKMYEPIRGQNKEDEKSEETPSNISSDGNEDGLMMMTVSSNFSKNLLLMAFLSVGMKIVSMLEYFKVRFGKIL